jgi:hypothetical protein
VGSQSGFAACPPLGESRMISGKQACPSSFSILLRGAEQLQKNEKPPFNRIFEFGMDVHRIGAFYGFLRLIPWQNIL